MKPKPLTREMILGAMANTKSNHAASRYLNCSYCHYKRYAKLYMDDSPLNEGETPKTLFDKHMNRHGKGIPKFVSGYGAGKFPILDIIEGRVSSDHFSPDKIKNAMIRDGLMKEYCACCGFSERRVSDYKMPLLMVFLDNNKRNYRPENCKLYCYNCYFLRVSDIFTNKQVLAIQDHKPINNGDVEWELDEYQLQQLNEIVKEKNEPKIDKEDGSEFISRQ